MSTPACAGPESNADDSYPLALLRNLLHQMMLQFAAQGACLALYDERVGQMQVQLHVRLRSTVVRNLGSEGIRPKRRLTVHLENENLAPSPAARSRSNPSSAEDLEHVSPQQFTLFVPGSTYPIGHDLIGFIWQKNEAYVMSQKDYLSAFYNDEPYPGLLDMVPGGYLAVPIQEPSLSLESPQQEQPNILGVIVLYQLNPGVGTEFHARQRSDALVFAERFALYLQNYALHRTQRRTSDYLQYLQGVSMVFPTSVKLADLVDNMYRFIPCVVDVSALLLTLYDRDTDRIYDVFASSEGMRMDDLSEQTPGYLESDRPIWWSVTQKDQQKLQFSPAQEAHKTSFYSELLTGVWGDQREAESFLFLPMRMYNRIIGSLSLVSKQPNAYHPEEVQVLETMLQIVTVGIENVKLYERDRKLLKEAKQREAQLAAINSTLQSIGSVLNVNQLLHAFVKSVASLVHVEISVFFQPSPDKDELVAQAMYAPPSARQEYDDDVLPPALLPPTSKDTEDELVTMIHLPFQHTILEQLVREGGFFYLDSAILDDLTSKSNEGGVLFLREINVEQMLMIPMHYQGDLIGMLAVSMPPDSRTFRPKDIGMLLAICAQTTSAIRNAQLFAQREEAYAELQRMDKLKDEFLVTASHELRTPLSAITGYSSMLKRQNARNSTQHILRYANKISSAAQQLTDLISKMTEAAQMGAADKHLILEPVPVLTAAEMAANLLTFNNEQALIREVPDTLWVMADALRFRQVLTNLLENAAKYSPAESTITLSASTTTLADVMDLLPLDQQDPVLLLEQEAASPLILIRVKDQGEGILPDDQEHIFEKFVRAPRSLTTPIRGSGLGLYICRRYVEAMGGKLWLEQSILNEGSVFTFYLPRVEPLVETREQVTGEYKTLSS